MTKKEARQKAKNAYALWTSGDPGRPSQASRAIWTELEATDAFRRAGTVLLYMSIEGEVMTRDFIDRWSGTKRIALPVVKGDVLRLKAYDPSCLQEGYRGITEPSDDAVDIDPSEVGLAVIPGAAFARNGSAVLRLGRGGGFYDRLLPLLECPRIGVCYSCRVLEEIPTDPWDIALDGLITDK